MLGLMWIPLWSNWFIKNVTHVMEKRHSTILITHRSFRVTDETWGTEAHYNKIHLLIETVHNNVT